ncbi:hypothetical protein [Selenomonas sp. AB3002]|uniref:hypothetical protein n=1 Tax=Selenomonas sp. AB3002 TaxID=1392502 RepID=UPI0004971466
MGKKITIAAGANPFDKSKSAAENMFAPQAPTKEHIDIYEYAEQQKKQHQRSDTDNAEIQPQKKTPRQFPGKQHIHLILPDRQANMIKQLAKMSGISVNQFMSQAVDQLYEEHWKPVVEALEQNRHKLGLDKKTDKSLFS